MTDILKIIKKIAVDAVNSQKPVNVIYGTVISTNPLRVQIDQKLILESEHLKLTKAVIDHTVDMTVNGLRQTYTIHNGFKKGDRVTMLRAQGGQQYLVIDKEVV